MMLFSTMRIMLAAAMRADAPAVALSCGIVPPSPRYVIVAAITGTPYVPNSANVLTHSSEASAISMVEAPIRAMPRMRRLIVARTTIHADNTPPRSGNIAIQAVMTSETDVCFVSGKRSCASASEKTKKSAMRIGAPWPSAASVAEISRARRIV